jgi:hypothetical protein
LAVCRDGEQLLEADLEPTDAWIPELQQAGEAVSSDYFVEAFRLDGDLWEVRAQRLNEQLLSSAGLEGPWEPSEPEPVYAPGWDAQQALLAEGGAVVTVNAPEIAGDAVEFATLPDGNIIVDEEQGDANLSPLADAVEEHLRPPYRASGVRQLGDLWAVAAHPIDVESLRCNDGDELELVCRGGRLSLRVDGFPSDLRIPELERIGGARGQDYVVEASRLDGDLWEIQANAL